MLLDRPGSGCSGSSVVAEARGITVGLPKPSTPSPGEFPNDGFRLHALWARWRHLRPCSRQREAVLRLTVP